MTDLTKGGLLAMPDSRAGRAYVLKGEVDFSANPVVQNGVHNVINVPAGTFVDRVMARVVTGEGAANTFEVGDGTDPDGFIAATSAENAGDVIRLLTLTEAAPNTVTGYSNGKHYAAADTIDIKAPGANGMDTAVIEVFAICFDLT